MKAKSLRFAICVLVALAFVVACFVFARPTCVFASAPAVAVQTTSGNIRDNYGIKYPESNANTGITLVVDGFDFDADADSVVDEGYSVAYSFIKLNSGGYVFNQFPNAIEITQNNPNGSFVYDFFKNGGVGSYRVKGVVLKDGKVVSHLQEIHITINPPIMDNSAGWSKDIEMQTIGTTANDFQLFNFKVVITHYGNAIDLSNYTIKWYVACDGGAPQYCGSGQSINWGAEELGVYTMNVEIDELNFSGTTEIGNMTKNYSMYAIIAFSALGGVLLIIAIITTIRKVKKERVW